MIIVVMIPLAITMLLLQPAAGTQAPYTFKYAVGPELSKGYPAQDFGLTEERLMKLEADAWREALDVRNAYRPTTLADLAKRLRNIADRILQSQQISDEARAYVLTYVVAAWTTSNMRYVDIGDGKSQTTLGTDGKVIEFEERGKWINIFDFLRGQNLLGACRHSSVLVREILNRAGADLKLRAYYLGGYTRGLSGPLPSDYKPTHTWNLVVLPSGRRMVFDATGNTRSREELDKRRTIFYPSPEPWKIIPRSREELENFFALRYGTVIDGWFEPADSNGYCTRNLEKLRNDPKQCHFMDMTLKEWLAADNRSVQTVNDYIYKAAMSRAKGK